MKTSTILRRAAETLAMYNEGPGRWAMGVPSALYMTDAPRRKRAERAVYEELGVDGDLDWCDTTTRILALLLTAEILKEEGL